MKVRVCLVIDVDQKEWAAYNGIKTTEVRADVKETIPLWIYDAVREIRHPLLIHSNRPDSEDAIEVVDG